MSEHVVSSPEISIPHAPSSGTGRIWKVFWLLSVVTLVELVLGFGLAKHWYGDPETSHTAILFVKGALCILSLAKAFYIVSVFMHLGDEIRNMIMTIVVPLCLFIWFIAAFLWDGNSWRNLKNTNAGSRPAQTEQHQAKPVDKDAKK
ncbi:MAG: cytochrome C oxidase subunit IV family protein [Chitinophagaceae bacterium]|nr:cytochrome C oxidase subunit IV family protein [Chitinophagaceae bacterium]MBL0055430.1 cytochrome C oxidase subunit IV family protein [Chitinophagaceae bacterium]